MQTQATGYSYSQDLMTRVRERAAKVAAQDGKPADLDSKLGQVETYTSWPKPGLWESFKNALAGDRERGERMAQATVAADGQVGELLTLETDGPYGMDGTYSKSAHSLALRLVESGSPELQQVLAESREVVKESIDGGFTEALQHHVDLCVIVGLPGPKRIYQELNESRSFQPGTIHDWRSASYGMVVEDVQTGRTESVQRQQDSLRTPCLTDSFHLSI